MSTCERRPRAPRGGRLRAARAVLAVLREDVATVRAKDPAARSGGEVLLYPHIHALWTYRVSHRLWGRGHRVPARALSLLARAVSGIEIHPGAVIGRRFFVDHGTAVVIGETVRIGDDVMLYHQVTLGSVGWWKDLRRPAGSRRHPVVGDGVIIGTGASVLGPVTVGDEARIGAHAVVLHDLPAGARVTAAESHTYAWDEPLPDVPEVHEVPDRVHGAADVAEAAGAHEEPEASADVPDVAETEEAGEVSEAAEVPDVPDVAAVRALRIAQHTGSS